MKVLHIITGLKNGGAEAVLYRLIMGSKEGITHEVISFMDAEFYGGSLAGGGICVHKLDMPRGRLTLRALIRLYRLIRSFNPDIIQTWLYHADLVGGMVAALAGKRAVVWGVHHSNLDVGMNSCSTRLVVRVCAKISGAIPRRIISCSQQAAQVHVSLGYDADKMIVIHNGCDVNVFKPDDAARARIRSEWDIGKDEILLGMVARWEPQKDHANLLSSLAYVRQRVIRPWRCMLVGPGMESTNGEVKALAEKHGVRERLLLAGPRNDIAAVMNALDLHVLSSSGEAFGNVTIEAMSCGVPAVVTSVGAGAIIVGDAGWVVQPSDPEALGGAIIAAVVEMALPDMWARRKAACRSRVIEHFGIERMIGAYQRVWETAMGL